MAYALTNSYAGETLLSGFNWFNGTDLSNGFVSYQSREDARAQNLYSIDPDTNVVRLGVDSTNTYALDEGRPSIRLESKQAFTQGLFIADFLHMPPSQCGLWPAFWAYGEDWPENGELDIIEGANTAHNNIISAHTAEGCLQDDSQMGLFSGELRNLDCYVGDANVGCGYNPPDEDGSSYGDGFNAVNGGVYAMQWDEEYIKVWHFARGQIPADIEVKAPNPIGWGLPQAVFGGKSCDVDSYFKDMSLVININFCGDYGNNVWGKADTCTDFAPTCPEYVANNPEAFANAYWDVKFIDTYEFRVNATPIAFRSDEPEPTTTTTMTRLSTSFVTVDPPSRTSTPADIISDLPAGASAQPTTIPSASIIADESATTTLPNTSATPVNPATIDRSSYLGCFASNSSFETFRLADSSDGMTPQVCVTTCGESTYAGVFGRDCYCADTFDAGTRATSEQDACDVPCPGPADLFCGGGIADNRLLTVYGSVLDDAMPAPPPKQPLGSADNAYSVDGQFHEATATVVVMGDDCSCSETGTPEMPPPPPKGGDARNITGGPPVTPAVVVAAASGLFSTVWGSGAMAIVVSALMVFI